MSAESRAATAQIKKFSFCADFRKIDKSLPSMQMAEKITGRRSLEKCSILFGNRGWPPWSTPCGIPIGIFASWRRAKCMREVRRRGLSTWRDSPLLQSPVGTSKPLRLFPKNQIRSKEAEPIHLPSRAAAEVRMVRGNARFSLPVGQVCFG